MIDFTLGICCLSRDFPTDNPADWVASDACAVVFQLCPRSLHLPYKPYETTFARIFLFLETVGLLDWRALYAIEYIYVIYRAEGPYGKKLCPRS